MKKIVCLCFATICLLDGSFDSSLVTILTSSLGFGATVHKYIFWRLDFSSSGLS